MLKATYLPHWASLLAREIIPRSKIRSARRPVNLFLFPLTPRMMTMALSPEERAFHINQFRASYNDAPASAGFQMANMASLIRVLVGGGFTADLLAAIAKVFDLGGKWKKYPEMSEAAQVRIDAAYIALVIIFTELFSTPEHPVDQAWAAPLIAARRGQGGGEVNAAQMEGSLLAQSVLTKAEQFSLLTQSDAGPLERGLLEFPKRQKGK
jgi:hypothetical protein